MIEDESVRLRDLVDDYYHGLIDVDSYRSERGRLLDALLAVRDESPQPRDDDVTAPQTTRKQRVEAVPFPQPHVDPRQPPAPRAVPARRGLPVLPMASGVVVVLVASLAAWLFWPAGDDSRPSEPMADVPRAEVAIEAPSQLQRGEALVLQFMEQENWNDQRVSTFLFQWDQMTDAEQAQLREAETFRRFVSEVRKRILVDRAVGAPEFRDGMSLSEALSVELELGLSTDRTNIREAVVDQTARIIPAPAPAPAPTETIVAAGAVPAQGDAAETAVAPLPAVVVTSEPEVAEVAVAAPLEPAAREAPAAPEPEDAPQPADAVAAERAEPAEPQESPAAGSATSVAQAASEQPCSVDRLKYRSSTCWDMLDADTKAPVLQVLPGGEFVMGDADDPAASPAQPRIVDEPFAIGMFEITNREYELFCRDVGRRCPVRRWTSDDHPVVDVSWTDAQAYVDWLSTKTGARYRLPTETEWEYAARGGTTTRFPFGDRLMPEDARYDAGIASAGPLPGNDRTTRQNGFRLMHIVGNVREWTADPWRETYVAPPVGNQVVLRGGSYADPAHRLRSAARQGAAIDLADGETGIRVVRDL